LRSVLTAGRYRTLPSKKTWQTRWIADVHGQSTSLTMLAKVGLAEDSATLATEAVITKRILGVKKATTTQRWVTVHAHFDRTRP
jgi:hypothetical protein